MGCWNKTCGLSNLHITVGTPVYVFVLEQNQNYDSCHTTGLFSPLLLPFEAIYDDYGGGEDSHGVGLPLIMQGIKERFIETSGYTQENFTVEQFFFLTHDQDLKIRGYRSHDPVSLHFTMFRKDIVDHILENRVIEKYVGNSRGNCGWDNNYISIKFADIAASVRPLLNKILSEESQRIFHYDMLDRHHDEFLAASWIEESYRYSRIVSVLELIRAAISAGTTEALDTLEPIVIEYLKGVFIENFMSSARKTWIPGGHEGSQSYSGASLRLLANATLDVLDKECEAWLEENEGEYIEE